MPETIHRNRKAVSIENEKLRVAVTVEGGHIAEIFHKPTGINPLWTPPWPSIEPSTYERSRHPEYGADAESKLLAGIMGHNLCMDIFGGVSEEEAAAGLTVHGEASVAAYRIESSATQLTQRAVFQQAQLFFQRRIELAGDVVLIQETVDNLATTDRPIGWTQHATLGPPFLERGKTEFRLPGTKSKVYETDFSMGKGYMKIGAEFEWPNVPHKNAGTVDLRVYPSQEVSAGFTAHLMDPAREQAYFVAWQPSSQLAFGYVWRQKDFPWLGIWEENHCRTQPPWNGKALTRGMEFGVSPMPETRRQMIERGSMFGVPGFRWIPAKKSVMVSYCAFARKAERIPESASWDGASGVTL